MQTLKFLNNLVGVGWEAAVVSTSEGPLGALFAGDAQHHVRQPVQMGTN